MKKQAEYIKRIEIKGFMGPEKHCLGFTPRCKHPEWSKRHRKKYDSEQLCPPAE